MNLFLTAKCLQISSFISFSFHSQREREGEGEGREEGRKEGRRERREKGHILFFKFFPKPPGYASIILINFTPSVTNSKYDSFSIAKASPSIERAVKCQLEQAGHVPEGADLRKTPGAL